MIPVTLIASQVPVPPSTAATALAVAPSLPVQVPKVASTSNKGDKGKSEYHGDKPSDNSGAAFAQILGGISQSTVQYSLDQETGIVSFKIVDSSTKEVICQVPSEEVLAMARRIKAGIGVFIDKRG